MKHNYLKISPIYLLIGLMSAFSCQEKKNIEATYLKDDSTNTNVTTNSSIAKNPVITQNSTVPSNATSLTAAASGVNPEHGKPGHRCDIPVGAPLSSPPKGGAQAKPATSTQQFNITPSQTQTITPQADTKNQNVAPGMNPPHGQPGHRCDIPVGQPLDSKPAAKNNPAPTTSKPLPATVAAPNSTTNSTPAATAPGMNPPHGQPGHRCDIGVGEPLSKK